MHDQSTLVNAIRWLPCHAAFFSRHKTGYAGIAPASPTTHKSEYYIIRGQPAYIQIFLLFLLFRILHFCYLRGLR